jgi:hypothetical protein
VPHAGSARESGSHARLQIAVPDDFPSVFEGTPAHERLTQLGDVKVFTARGAEEEA